MDTTGHDASGSRHTTRSGRRLLPPAALLPPYPMSSPRVTSAAQGTRWPASPPICAAMRLTLSLPLSVPLFLEPR